MRRTLYTMAEVADLLAVSVRTVQRLRDRGDLAVVTVGRSVRVTPQAVDAYIRKGDRSPSRPSPERAPRTHRLGERGDPLA